MGQPDVSTVLDVGAELGGDPSWPGRGVPPDHHTWQVWITPRRAFMPSMLLSFTAMASSTALFPAS